MATTAFVALPLPIIYETQQQKTHSSIRTVCKSNNQSVKFTTFNITGKTNVKNSVGVVMSLKLDEDVKTLCREGRLREALGFLHLMNQQGIPVSSYAYASLFQACANIGAVIEGKQVHAHMLKNDSEQKDFIESELISLYAMCSNLEDARKVFDKSLQPNVALWNAMIRGYAKDGFSKESLELFYLMARNCVPPDKFTFPLALQACATLSGLRQGREIHAHIIKMGFESDVYVGNALVDMYSKCGMIEDACEVFDKMSARDGVSWNSVIAGCVQSGHADEALELFCQMQVAGVKPDPITIVSILMLCAQLEGLQQGTEIHGFVIRNRFDSDVFVSNSLIDMYAKCGYAVFARRVFDNMLLRNVVSWNVMIAGYTNNECSEEALKLFCEMQVAGIKPTSTTILSVLHACAQLSALLKGMELHNYATKNGFESNVKVGSALIDMYGKCGNVDIAYRVFNKMAQRNLVSWNAMIAGFTQDGDVTEVFRLVYQMQLSGMRPDSFTIVSVLQMCVQLEALQKGKEIHVYIIKNGLDSNIFVRNALMDMYVRCRSIEAAHQVFDSMSVKDLVSWNVMLAGYGQNGHANDALKLFHQMQQESVKPSTVTIASVLSVCSQLAALQHGKETHNYAVRNGFELNVLVGNALVAMYARCGSIDDGRQVFDKISEKDVVSWNSIIAGHGMHGLGKEALMLFNQMQSACIKPDHITFVAVLSACSHSGLVNEGWQYFDSMSQEYQLAPTVEHYTCMVDLLGRVGHLDKAQELIRKMPVEPDAHVWGSLLAACRIHCNIEVGEYVAEKLIELDPKNSGHYILLSNIYSAAGRWVDAAKMRTAMKERGVKKMPGYSWIEVNSRVQFFLVGDRSHPESEQIYAMLESLAMQIKKMGYLPDTNFVLHDVEEEEKEHILWSHSEKLALAFGLINTHSGMPIRITKNLRICGDCHSATKFISKAVGREIIMRDLNRFHHFKDGLCSCGDYW